MTRKKPDPYTTYKGKPTNAKRIIDYLKDTPFKQMAISRIQKDLEIDKEVLTEMLSRMARRGQIERRLDGKMCIVGIKTKTK